MNLKNKLCIYLGVWLTRSECFGRLWVRPLGSNLTSALWNSIWCPLTLVPEVFWNFSSRKRERAAKRRQVVAMRRGGREKPLVTFASNLTFMQMTGSGSDPRALNGWYFYKHTNLFRNLTSWSFKYFSLEIFKLSELQRKSALSRLT